MKSPECVPVQFPEKLTVSNSLVREWLRCRRAFLFNYLMRLTPTAVRIPLWVGSHFHDGIKKFYDGKAADQFVPPILKTMEKEIREFGFLTPEDEENMAKAVAVVEGMLRGYTARYAKEKKTWKSVKAELRFSVPLARDVEYVGGVDLVVQDGEGQHIMEHKTAGRIDKNYVDRLPLDRQITGYAVGVQHETGIPVKKIIYNVVKKPELRQKAGESHASFTNRIIEDYHTRPDFYFYREELYRDVRAVAEFKEEIWEIVLDIEEATKRLKEDGVGPSLPVFYRNTDSCAPIGRPCSYLPICTKGWGDDLKSLYRIRETLNPEFEKEEIS